MTAPETLYECEEDHCDEHVSASEAYLTQAGREVCHDCFESGYDRDGYPIAERMTIQENPKETP